MSIVSPVTPSESGHPAQEELNKLLYILSHDFGAPLRHIREFSKLLTASIEQPDEDQEEFSRLINGAVEKLDAMLGAVLALSRLNTDETEPGEVALLPLIQKQLEELQHVHADVVFNASVDDNLPIVFGKAGQIESLFSALLENAFVHGKQDNQLTLDIAVTQRDANTVIVLQDSGNGIEERFREEVFNLFRQLAPNRKQPRVGSGLTLAKKIAELHGGQVSIVEPVPLEGGARVEVILPYEPNNARG